MSARIDTTAARALVPDATRAAMNIEDEDQFKKARDAIAQVPALCDEVDELRAELAKWRRSFAGHVYVKNEDYAALVQAADPNGGAAYVKALKDDQVSAIRALRKAQEEVDELRAALALLTTQEHPS